MYKSPKEPIIERCYFYSLWSGDLKIYEGSVYQSPWTGVGSFRSKTKGGQCSAEPGVVYNAVVWLEERNDDLAKQILIEYEETAIAALQEKIDNHMRKIKILKGE